MIWNIPKILHCIWIGTLPPPMKWINSRKEKHPTREYKLRWNKELEETSRINQKAIDIYKSQNKRSAIADIMRYEILYSYGWAMHWADSLCTNAIDELFEDWAENYAVDTSHRDWREVLPTNIWSAAPLYACKKWSSLARRLIDEISQLTEYKSAAMTVGNRLMQKVINTNEYPIKIRPQHYFIPIHYDWRKYEWPDKTYAQHYRWTTRGTYEQWLE